MHSASISKWRQSIGVVLLVLAIGLLVSLPFLGSGWGQAWTRLTLLVVVLRLVVMDLGGGQLPASEGPREDSEEPQATDPEPPSGQGQPMAARRPEDGAARPATDQWLEAAFEEASGELRQVRQQLNVLSAGDRSGGRDSADATAARRVAALVDRWADLPSGGRDRESVDRLRSRAARLRAAAPAHEPSASQLSRLMRPEEWRREGRSVFDYLGHVSAVVNGAKQVLAEVETGGARALPTGGEWRATAEDLLVQVAAARMKLDQDGGPPSRRDAVRSIYQELLDLLEVEETPVGPGDRIDRQLHEVESHVVTSDWGPNRVVRVVLPGFRDPRSGEVLRRALVQMSVQSLD